MTLRNYRFLLESNMGMGLNRDLVNIIHYDTAY